MGVPGTLGSIGVGAFGVFTTGVIGHGNIFTYETVVDYFQTQEALVQFA